MRSLDWYIVASWLNVVFFFISAVTASLASVNTTKEVRIIKRLKSVVAGGYFFGILWSLTIGEQSEWAPIARGLGVAAIPIVYIIPDIVGMRWHQRSAQFAENSIIELKQKIERETGEQ